MLESIRIPWSLRVILYVTPARFQLRPISNSIWRDRKNGNEKRIKTKFTTFNRQVSNVLLAAHWPKLAHKKLGHVQMPCRCHSGVSPNEVNFYFCSLINPLNWSSRSFIRFIKDKKLVCVDLLKVPLIISPPPFCSPFYSYSSALLQLILESHKLLYHIPTTVSFILKQ